MSTASDVARVFTDTEEQTYSIFSSPEQAMPIKGHYNRSIIKKMVRMKYYDYIEEDEILKKKQEAVEVTESGHTFTGDDLIAL